MAVSMRDLRWWWLAGPALLVACVTINIYFPAAAVEKAAEQIIREVRKEKSPEAQTPAPPPSGELSAPIQRGLALGDWLLELAMPTARAQSQANINIDTPAINRLQSAMAARFQRMSPYYDNGAIGLTSDGFLVVRDLNAVPLKDRPNVSRWVAEENSDRRVLYKEIARANGHPEWEAEIQATFARKWISLGRPGWWYQSGSGWVQR